MLELLEALNPELDELRASYTGNFNPLTPVVYAWTLQTHQSE
jgi:hypothetical protein